MRRLTSFFTRLRHLWTYRTATPRLVGWHGVWFYDERGRGEAPLYVYKPGRVPTFTLVRATLLATPIVLAVLFGPGALATVLLFGLLTLFVGESRGLATHRARAVNHPVTKRAVSRATDLWLTASPAEHKRVGLLPAKVYELAELAQEAREHLLKDDGNLDAPALEWHKLVAAEHAKALGAMCGSLTRLCDALESELATARAQKRSPREVTEMSARYDALRSRDYTSEIDELTEAARKRSAVLLASLTEETPDPAPRAAAQAWDEVDRADATKPLAR